MDVKGSDWNYETKTGKDVGEVHVEGSIVFGETMATKPLYMVLVLITVLLHVYVFNSELDTNPVLLISE